MELDEKLLSDILVMIIFSLLVENRIEIVKCVVAMHNFW